MTQVLPLRVSAEWMPRGEQSRGRSAGMLAAARARTLRGVSPQAPPLQARVQGHGIGSRQQEPLAFSPGLNATCIEVSGLGGLRRVLDLPCGVSACSLALIQLPAHAGDSTSTFCIMGCQTITGQAGGSQPIKDTVPQGFCRQVIAASLERKFHPACSLTHPPAEL